MFTFMDFCMLVQQRFCERWYGVAVGSSFKICKISSYTSKWTNAMCNIECVCYTNEKYGFLMFNAISGNVFIFMLNTSISHHNIKAHSLQSISTFPFMMYVSLIWLCVLETLLNVIYHNPSHQKWKHIYKTGRIICHGEWL